MDNLFDVIITGDDVINPKPHPEGRIKALSLLGVRDNEAMFIKDERCIFRKNNLDITIKLFLLLE